MNELIIICEKEIPNMDIVLPKMWVHGLSFHSCGFKKIGKDTFLNVRQLYFLFLTGMPIKGFEFNPDSLQDVQHFFINGNEISHVKKGMFPKNVDTIELNGNPIETIDVDAFDGLEKLTELRLPLHHENIIPDGLFKKPLERLVLRGFSSKKRKQNKINCTSWLFQYLLTNGVTFHFEDGLTCSPTSDLFPGKNVDRMLKGVSETMVKECSNRPDHWGDECSKEILENLKVHQKNKNYRRMSLLEYYYNDEL